MPTPASNAAIRLTPAPAARRSWYLKSVWIFDFDGTLVNSMGWFADLASDVMERHHGIGRAVAREHYRQTSGIPFAEQLARLFPGHPANQAAATAYETAKAARYLALPPFPDVQEALARLRGRGCGVAVSSNNFQSLVEAYVQAHGIAADWVCGWQPGFAKGAAHFAHVARASGARAEDTVFVGDSLSDVRRARALGMDFVGRVGTFRAEEFRALDPDLPLVTALTDLL